MINEFNDDGTGWALFSDDRVMRYRLARSLTGQRLAVEFPGAVDLLCPEPAQRSARIVWLMLNPSTADAFVLDPTVNECRKRSLQLGADVMEVVNLFALRSPYPADLQKCAAGYRGDDSINNDAILKACTGARYVVAAWGNHGAIGGRDRIVRDLLRMTGVPLWHLGKTNDGFPKHPLARGKHRIPQDQVLAPLEIAALGGER